MKFHYVYRITNIKIKKHYYGVRTSQIKPVEDIGYIYFSSSKDKLFICDQKVNPDNYKYKVVKEFNTRLKATQYEIKLHNKFDVGINEFFYNRAKSSSSSFDRSGTILTESHKAKISKAHIGLKHTDETKKKLSENKKGKKLSKEHKLSIKKSLEVVSDETRSKMSESARKNMTEEKRKLISSYTKGKNNGMAKEIIIFNKNGDEIFRVNGSFKNFCSINDLPYKSLMNSYKNGKKLYETKASKTKAYKNGNNKFIGWFAKINL